MTDDCNTAAFRVRTPSWKSLSTHIVVGHSALLRRKSSVAALVPLAGDFQAYLLPILDCDAILCETSAVTSGSPFGNCAVTVQVSVEQRHQKTIPPYFHDQVFRLLGKVEKIVPSN
uniref:Uncharacterized protein n=1 Tax=Rhipicephalus microplus TaxID=6941 RepID=A0A6G5AGD4_RHIMP